MVLDLSLLQTLVAAVDLGGFGKAAAQLHRSPGAISLQIKALEERVGAELFRKSGRQQTLTEAGELLVGFARRMLQINGDALLAVQGVHLAGEVRFGMPQDFADSWLPQALAQFARAYPAVRIAVTVDRSPVLLSALKSDHLDLVLAFGDADTATSEILTSLPVQWIASPNFSLGADAAVPLLVLDQPCGFRQAATDALDRAGRPWRIALTSASVSGIWAAAKAGLGVTARTTAHIPPELAPASAALRLPRLHKVRVSLHRDGATTNPAAVQLWSVVKEVVSGQLPRV